MTFLTIFSYFAQEFIYFSFLQNIVLTLTESNPKPFLFWNVHFKADFISKYTMLYVLQG